MRKTRFLWMGAGLLLAMCAGQALADYRPPPKKTAPVREEGDFERSVDLGRFRKGNLEWDTQELIASGFTALHRENQKILKELAEIKQALAGLQADR